MDLLDDVLLRLAPKYVWWQQTSDATLTQRRLVAQIMNMGTFADVKMVEERLGEAVFRDALQNAEPGWFSARSWAYWNNRLGMVRESVVSEPPRRRF